MNRSIDTVVGGGDGGIHFNTPRRPSPGQNYYYAYYIGVYINIIMYIVLYSRSVLVYRSYYIRIPRV